MTAADDELYRIACVRDMVGEFFPGGEPPVFHPLIHGGSDRMFYRVRRDSSSFVLCVTGNREELAYYIEFGQFFHSAGITVPGFLRHSMEEGVVLMEDAGDLSLFEKVRSSSDEEEIVRLYCETLRQLVLLQHIEVSRCPMLSARPFDYATLRWETSYFRENLLENYLSLHETGHLEAEFHFLAEAMAGEPRYPMHRDFQSQNLFIKEDRIYILDFQGARTGHLLYDVASLLKDPYVSLSPALQDRLLEWYYLQLLERCFISQEYNEFRRQFILISLQRLMQALGAFGFLGLKKGKRKFLEYILPALHQLTGALDECEEFPCIKGIVREALARAQEKSDTHK